MCGAAFADYTAFDMVDNDILISNLATMKANIHIVSLNFCLTEKSYPSIIQY